MLFALATNLRGSIFFFFIAQKEAAALCTELALQLPCQKRVFDSCMPVWLILRPELNGCCFSAQRLPPGRGPFFDTHVLSVHRFMRCGMDRAKADRVRADGACVLLPWRL